MYMFFFCIEPKEGSPNPYFQNPALLTLIQKQGNTEQLQITLYELGRKKGLVYKEKVSSSVFPKNETELQKKFSPLKMQSVESVFSQPDILCLKGTHLNKNPLYEKKGKRIRKLFFLYD